MPAFAVDWQPIAKSKDTMHYIDKDSIRTDGGNYYYDAIDKYKDQITRRQNVINCNSQTYRVIRFANYDNNGNYLGGKDINYKPKSIRQGTVVENYYNYLCR